jgi:hypothetical protein
MSDDQPSITVSDWIDTDAPAEGQSVQVREQDGHGFCVLPFVVIFRDDEWWNARTEKPLDWYFPAWRPMSSP